MSEEHEIYLRDIDGTGSLHPCWSEDEGARLFVSHETLKAAEAKACPLRDETLTNQLKAAEAAAYKQAAHTAGNACLVPPDGGSPSEEEYEVSERARIGILSLITFDHQSALDALIAETEARVRAECAAKLRNFRGHLNFEAFLQVLRDEPFAPEIVDAVSDILDGMADAIRALEQKEGE